MKLLNKKGFALVETLIVATFVMTIFIFTYQNLVPIIGEYEKMNSYDDIDSIYAANLYNQVILKHANLNYIDSELTTKTYVDVSNCDDTNIYVNSDYCKKMKTALSISKDDYIFITNYDISRFREEVKENEFFDSGKLSNFKSYINTVGDVDSFYDITANYTANGKYRLFMTRTVLNSDNSTSLKYTNLGIFLGKYKKYNIGDKILFDPGTGEQEFFVLKNSETTESTVTLIAANSVTGNTVFNTTNANSIPTNALTLLKQKTDGWSNVEVLTTNDNFVSSNGYTISYNGYRARLLNGNDIYSLLGCDEDHSCFDTSSLFTQVLDEKFSFLYNGLTDNTGYWLANAVLTTDDMAWTVQNGKLVPELISDTTIGVRPVVVVSKDKLLNAGE